MQFSKQLKFDFKINWSDIEANTFDSSSFMMSFNRPAVSEDKCKAARSDQKLTFKKTMNKNLLFTVMQYLSGNE